MNIELSTSAFPVFLFLFISLVIYLVFKGINKFSIAAKITIKQKRFLQRNLPLIELLIWFVFLAWTIDFFIDKNDLFAGALIIVFIIALFWIAKFAIKEFIAGIVFRSSTDFYINDIIQIDNIKGKILKMSYQKLEIENEQGLTTQIPYSQIIEKIRKKTASENLTVSRSFTINIKSDDKIDKKVKLIEKQIINSPYSALNKWPKIEIIEKTSSKLFKIRITLHALNSDYFHLIKEDISQKFCE